MGANMDKVPETRGTFPSTIDGFGYVFSEQGELRSKDGGPFVFEVRKGDREYNQRHYEALGECITPHVYNLLETDCGLMRATVPVDAREGEPNSFLFHSADLMSNDAKLMVLIHGSGVVRAGQWARRLIINDNLNCGTQIPYIKRAMLEGYAVLVLNTNNGHVIDSRGRRAPVPQNSSPEAHGVYAFEHFVKNSPARDVYIVAHSYGGCVVTELARRSATARQRVTQIAFTDSVHSLYGCDDVTASWMRERTVNWVSSSLDRDSSLSKRGRGDVTTVSAGVSVHEWTSHSAFDSVFTFFADSTTFLPTEAPAKLADYSSWENSPIGVPRASEDELHDEVRESASTEEGTSVVNESTPMDESTTTTDSMPMEDSAPTEDTIPLEESEPSPADDRAATQTAAPAHESRASPRAEDL